MKKVFIAIVFVSSIMAACQKTDIVGEARIPLEFRGEMVKQTKASGNPSAENDGQMDNLYAQDFRVWAFKNWDDPLTTTTNEINTEYDGISNLLISYKSATTTQTQGTWDTGKDYYWPGVNKSLKFYAVSSSNMTTKEVPENAETVTITHHDVNSTSIGTMKIANFTVTDKADNDLMVADACIQMQKGSTEQNGVVVGNAVTQTFRHALTKVRFSFITTSETIPVFVQNVTTTVLTNAGDLDVEFGESTSFKWDPKDTKAFSDDYNEEIDFSVKNVNNVYQIGATEATAVADLSDKTGITLNKDDYTDLDTWLMIPQDLTNETTVTITYILKDRQFARTFSLAADDLEAWTPNQFVNYKVTIAPNVIEFSATVEGWTEHEVDIDDSSSES